MSAANRRRSSMVSVRLSADEAERLRGQAEQEGISLSEFVRRRALEVAEPRGPLPWNVTVSGPPGLYAFGVFA